MDYELERLYKEYQGLFKDTQDLFLKSQQQTLDIEKHLSAVADEYSRVVNLSGQAGYVLNKIDRDFQEKTKLNGWEIVLLFTCVGLQCVRQYLLTNEVGRFNDTIGENGRVGKRSNQKGDEFVERIYDNSVGLVAPPDWKDVLFQSVPYDAIATGPLISDTGLSGTTHRYRTLGHDPVLGWIFGTANIMTNSLTKHNFVTYRVENMVIVGHYPLGVAGMLAHAAKYATSDPKLLLASIARQMMHYGSDMFTKQGLPVPLISTLNNDLAKDMLSKWHIDTYSILRGTGLAALINKLIFFVHQFFYDENKHGSRELFEVKTRKILSYSNLIATGSNIIVSVVARDGKLLDVGGLIVTILRLVSDYKFINKIKQEFLEKEFYKTVVGDNYDFM